MHRRTAIPEAAMVAVRLLTAVVAAALLALPVVTACGDEDEGTATAPPAATATVPTGPAPPGASDGAAGIMLAGSGLSVAEIPGAPADEILAVRAYVVVAPDGSAQLCDALAESHPPQCGGASMPLTGLPDGFLTGLRSAEGVRWSDAPLQLLGRVRDGVFENDADALVAG
jgi:hypothetical protein